MIGESELVAVGLNHHTAPVEVRERLAIGPEALSEHLHALTDRAHARESLILSTCNRVEVYALVGSEDAGRGILTYLSGTAHHGGRPLRSLLYRHMGSDAVTHLFRVASSLDSQVVGEPQILGQLKQAFRAAQQEQTVGTVLQRLMRRAISVGKRVRTETGVGRKSVSVGTAGVEVARQVFGKLEGRVVLVLGAGDMARLVLRSLLDHGVDELLVVNRTPAAAETLAADFGGTAVPYDQLARFLEQVDLVVASTASQRFLVTPELMGPVMRTRRYRPLFFLDLSVPRNIDPDVNDLEGAFLFNIDDLGEVARRGLEKRMQEAEEAEELVRREALRCYQGLGALSAAPVIAGMTRQAEDARLQELERSRTLLKGLDSRQREAVEAMTRAMFKRFLHHPIHRARRLAQTGDGLGLQLLEEAFTQGEE